MTTPTLLFGDDGSVGSDVAWLWINGHRWPGWRLDVVEAVMPTFVRASAEPVALQPWTPLNPRRPFIETAIDDVHHLTGDQDPRLALSRAADLLVIGSRGRGLGKALHLGSTAEWLMAHPPAPMIVVRHGRPTMTVMVCHDGSTHARSATATLCAMPWIADVSVTVVGVDDGRADVERAVGEAIAALGAVGARATERILHGEPTHQLTGHLQRGVPDLLVLGTRGLTGVRRLRIGSTAGTLAHAVDTTVLLACAVPAVGDPDHADPTGSSVQIVTEGPGDRAPSSSQ